MYSFFCSILSACDVDISKIVNVIMALFSIFLKTICPALILKYTIIVMHSSKFSVSYIIIINASMSWITIIIITIIFVITLNGIRIVY